MKQKPIIIWWGVDTSEDGFEEGIIAEEPTPILKKFLIENKNILKAYLPYAKDRVGWSRIS